MKRWIILAGCAFLLAGCNADVAPGYFPLGEGLQWHYRVTRSDPLGSRDSSRLVLSTLGATALGGERVFERRNSFGIRYYIDKRTDGYYRVGKRRVVDYRIRFDEPPRMILPRPPRAGAHWQHATTTYLLKQIFPVRERYRHGAPIEMDFRVAATNLEVMVPAGRYRGCVRVDGQAHIKVASDPRHGFSDVPLTQSEWYCPGVGLVRLTRQEKLYSEQARIIGGRLEMELMRLENGFSWLGLFQNIKSWL